MIILTKEFKWQGIDNHGKIIHGKQRAQNKSQLKKTLYKRNITLLTTKQKINLQTNQVKPKDIYQFTMLLSQLLQSGIQLIDALNIIYQQTKNQRLLTIINEIIQAINNGTAFHVALQQHSNYFNSSYCSLIAAGEKTGQLEQTLQQLCSQLQQTIELKDKINKALMYPICVLTLSLIISLGLIVFALPKFASIYQSFNAPLPTITRYLINLSSLLHNHWLLLGLCLFVTVILLKVIHRKNKFMTQFGMQLINKLPIIAPITQHVIITRWCGLFRISLQSGLATAQALNIANDAIDHPAYQTQLKAISQQIIAGSRLSHAMQQATLFPDMLARIISIAEEGASLSTLLAQVENQYQQKLKFKLDSLTQLLEPIFMVLLAIILGTIIIAIYLPIFQMGAVM